MSMIRAILIVGLILPLPAVAVEVFRCESDGAIIWSDRPCAADAERFQLNIATHQGIGGDIDLEQAGENLRNFLAQRKAQREQQRREAREREREREREAAWALAEQQAREQSPVRYIVPIFQPFMHGHRSHFNHHHFPRHSRHRHPTPQIDIENLRRKKPVVPPLTTKLPGD